MGQTIVSAKKKHLQVALRQNRAIISIEMLTKMPNIDSKSQTAKTTSKVGQIINVIFGTQILRDTPNFMLVS